jgi:inorganic triphosphatase YgiF
VHVTRETEQLPREVEVALVVRSETPERVWAAVATLEDVDGLALVPGQSQHLRDRYLDTEGGDLGSRRYALRIREVDGRPRITLKGDAKRLATGVDRLELELPWSPAAASRVLAELRAGGVPIDDSVPLDEDPVAALAHVGLRVIQERETRRELRSVVDEAGAELAELDLDAVSYRFPHGEARLFEVELETRSPAADLGRIAGALQRAAPELVEWPHGKLVTGAALERALVAGAIHLRPDGVVTPDTLDRLSAALADDG